MLRIREDKILRYGIGWKIKNQLRQRIYYRKLKNT